MSLRRLPPVAAPAARTVLTRLRMLALLGAVLVTAAVLPGAASADAYEPAPWNPPDGHNVTTVRWGSITIPAATDPHAEQPGQVGAMHMKAGEVRNEIAVDGSCNPLVGLYTSCRSMEIPKPCEDCYITGVLPDLVLKGTDTSFNMDTGGMLHHVVNVNFSRPDPTCQPLLGFKPINNLGLVQGGNERFFAAGNERTVGQLAAGGGKYGYRVDRGDRWGLIYHLMNMRTEPVEVEFKYTFTWVRKAERIDPIWLDVDQCGDSEVDIPAGYSDLHWGTRAGRGGTLVGIGGHGHDGAIAVSLENVTKKQFLCTSVAGYAAGSQYAPVGPGPGTPGHPAHPNTVTKTGHPNAPITSYMGMVSDFTKCEPNARFDFFDEIKVHATYNTPAEGHSMGIMVAYVTR